MLLEEKHNEDELFDHAVNCAKNLNLIKDGDLVCITAGVPLGISGTTNMMRVHIVGDILITGTGITAQQVHANLCVCESEEEARLQFKPGEILVIPKTSNAILDLIKDCAGIITEQDGSNSHAAIVGLALGKPVLVGAKGATEILRTGTNVTLDAERGIVCNMANKT